jgi:hypothetical protein
MSGISTPNEIPIPRRKPSRPWQTVLTPYLALINQWCRQSPPLSYRAIALELERKFELKVVQGTVRSAVKERQKPRKIHHIHPSHLSGNHDERTHSRAGIDGTHTSSDWKSLLAINGSLKKYK